MQAQRLQDTFSPNEHTTLKKAEALANMKLRTGKTVRREPQGNQQAWKNSSAKDKRVALKGGSIKQGSKRVNENFNAKYLDYDMYNDDEDEQQEEYFEGEGEGYEEGDQG